MNIALIISSYDSGLRNVRFGAGPLKLVPACRAALRGHDVSEIEIYIEDEFPTEIATGFRVCREIAGHVAEARRTGRFPIVLAGNCFASIGVAAGIQADAAIWFDQHGDLNRPETSQSGMLDGMPFAVLLGRTFDVLAKSVPGFTSVAEDRAVLVDGRDLDPDERAFLSNSPVAHVAVAGAAEAAARLASAGAERIYMHIDLDVHDPDVLRANMFATPGGVTPEALRSSVSGVMTAASVEAVTLSAYDPAFDPADRMPDAVAELVGAIVASREARPC
jgi:arginase